MAGETSLAPGLASFPLLWGGEARCASPLASIFLGSRLLSGFWTPLATERAPRCSSDGCSESARGDVWALKAGERCGGVSTCPRRSQRCISAGLWPRREQRGLHLFAPAATPSWGEASLRSFCLSRPSFCLLWVQISDLFCSCAQQNVGIVNSGGVSLQDIREGIFYS